MRGTWRPWTWPLAILGTNSILLYTLSWDYRWWFLLHFKGVFGTGLFVEPYAPFIESVLFVAMLWVIAFVLHRLRIFVRV